MEEGLWETTKIAALANGPVSSVGSSFPPIIAVRGNENLLLLLVVLCGDAQDERSLSARS